jgi:hypothetical protein
MKVRKVDRRKQLSLRSGEVGLSPGHRAVLALGWSVLVWDEGVTLFHDIRTSGEVGDWVAEFERGAGAVRNGREPG